MRAGSVIKFVICVIVTLGTFNFLQAQDFSNKGNDFWFCFPTHTPNQRFDTIYYAKMSVFITGDKTSSGIIQVAGKPTKPFTVTAGNVTEVDVPYSDAHITTSEAGQVINKGIHVLTDDGKPPVIVYSQIYAGFRSAASLILPVNVLGKQYYSINAPQTGVSDSRSQFEIVAVDSNTSVEFTPKFNGVVQAPLSIHFDKAGQVYEYQSQYDLSGSYIEAVSTVATSCKKIAVFSGSSAVSINATQNCTGDPSYDPLFQQLYPVTAWGKNYGFIPFSNYDAGNPYRIIASEDNTSVYINNSKVATLNAGQFYPDNALFGTVIKQPSAITADKPVCVAQYAQRSGCSGTTISIPGKGYGDPDMVVLNPVEQQVNNITLFASTKENIYSNARFVNVLMPSNGVKSFTVNNAKPSTQWKTIKIGTENYSTAAIALLADKNGYTLQSDSGFNAVVYGFGDFESYAYSAGTNVKDLYRVVKIENEYGLPNSTVSCQSARFALTVTFPYKPDSIITRFNGVLPDTIIQSPVVDTSFMVNNRLVYRFRIGNNYSVNKTGRFYSSVIAKTSNGIICGNGEDVIDFILEIVNPPKSSFIYNSTGCAGDSILVKDNSSDPGYSVKRFFWQFTPTTSVEAGDSLKILIAGDGNKNITHWVANNIGCGSDTATTTIALTIKPQPHVILPVSLCERTTMFFKDSATTITNGIADSLYWSFGDGKMDSIKGIDSTKHLYNQAGTYQASLAVKTYSGCTVQSAVKTITINPLPVANFTVPYFCSPLNSGVFYNTSSIKNTAPATLLCQWDFGDATTDTAFSPLHTYQSASIYTVQLKVTSASGCTTLKQQTLVNRFVPAVHLNFDNSSPKTICEGDTISLKVLTPATDSATAIKNLYWVINNTQFIDTLLKPSPYAVHLWPTVGYDTVKVQVYASLASACKTDTINYVTAIHALPLANFTVPAILCDGDTTTLVPQITSDNIPGSHQFLWTFNNTTSTDSVVAKRLTKGKYAISLTVQNQLGCSSLPVVRQVEVNPSPIADFSYSQACVLDTGTQFTNLSAGGGEGTAGLSSFWQFATYGKPGWDTTSLPSPLHKYSRAGQYDVTLQVKNKYGCAADKTLTAQVNSNSAEIKFDIDRTDICANDVITITDHSFADTGAIQRLQIFWDYNNNLFDTTNAPLPITGTQYTHAYGNNTNVQEGYLLLVRAYTGNTCITNKTDSVIVNPRATLQQVTTPIICNNALPFLPAIVQNNNNLPGSGIYYGNAIDAEGFFNPQNAGAGNVAVYYKYTTAAGCTDSFAATITIKKAPVIITENEVHVDEGSSVQLLAQIADTLQTITWRPPLYLSAANITNPVCTPLQNIQYYITATGTNQCISNDTVNVIVKKKIKIPTAFSPNGDGINDYWMITNIDNPADIIIDVFTRSGQKVYHANGYNTPWNGTFNNTPLPVGTYYWIISYHTHNEKLSGFVEVVR